MSKYMSIEEARKAIVDVGKKIYNRNFVAANDGNISIRVGENKFCITPTMVSKGFMTEDIISVVNEKGNLLQGTKKASSEIKMHLRIYAENKDINAVVHAHPVYATSFAVAGLALDEAVLPEAVVNLGVVPIATYATPGTSSLSDTLSTYCKTHNAVLLESHGAVTWGANICEAYFRMKTLEHYAKILFCMKQILGNVKALKTSDRDNLIKLRESMGIKTGGMPKSSKN